MAPTDVADHDVIQAAEEALEDDARPPQVLRRHGMEAVRQQRLGELLRLMEDHDPGWGALAVGKWAAELVDDGQLVPRGDDGD